MKNYRTIKHEDGSNIQTVRDGNSTDVLRDGSSLGHVVKFHSHIEVFPRRGTYAGNAPSVAEGARILVRMLETGWI